MPKIYSVEKREDSAISSKVQKVEIDLSPKLLAIIAGVLAVIFFRKQLLSLVLFMMMAFVFMCAMRPVVSWFEKKGVSSGWAIFLAYTLLVLALLFLLTIIVAPFITQMESLIETLPKWIEGVTDWLGNLEIGGRQIDTAELEKSMTGWLKELPNASNVKNFTSAVGGVFEDTGEKVIFV